MLQRMPCLPYSRATTLVSPRNANFDAVYAPVVGTPLIESVEPMFTIDPPPDSIINGAQAWTLRNGPTQFTLSTRSNTSTDVEARGCRCKMAALFTSTSRRPQRARTSSTAPAQSDG